MTSTSERRADAAFQKAVVLHRQGRFAEAAEAYKTAIRHHPRHCDALHFLGLLALDAGNPDQAVELINLAVSIRPASATIHVHQGMALHRLGRHGESIKSFDKAMRLAPGDAHAMEQKGHAFFDRQRWSDALESYEKVIWLNPKCLEVFCRRGTALYYLRRFDEAIASYEKAIELNPTHAPVYNDLANVLREIGRYDAAVACYDQAISLCPGYAEAYYNRGSALREIQDFPAAIASYDQAATLKTDFRSLRVVHCYTRMQVCDWRNLDAEREAVAQRIERDEETSNPFFVLALTGSAALQKKAAEIWTRDEYPPALDLPQIVKRPRGEKIRVAYLSADFHDHATMHLMAGLFEAHDLARFAVTLISFGHSSQDAMRARLERACQDFLHVRDLSDSDIAKLCRDRHIDIAIDLKGFTRDNRAGIFALRAAPLQLGYLGYPGTMGAPYMDYLIADSTVIPQGSAHHYTEKIIHLPHTYQVNDRQRPICDRCCSREEAGLPRTGFVFCCFNSNYKITPGTFDVWMRILARTEKSVLWLLADSPTAANNLRGEARTRGVDPSRLIFAEPVALPDHLARHRLANLFLDTLPYGAHTTASDALWSGLAVLTCPGETFASRVAASLLNAIGLPELVTATLQKYEDAAVELACHPQRLREINERLAANRLNHPLFDTRLFTRHLEAAYTAAYERYQSDLPPCGLEIAVDT